MSTHRRRGDTCDGDRSRRAGGTAQEARAVSHDSGKPRCEHTRTVYDRSVQCRNLGRHVEDGRHLCSTHTRRAIREREAKKRRAQAEHERLSEAVMKVALVERMALQAAVDWRMDPSAYATAKLRARVDSMCEAWAARDALIAADAVPTPGATARADARSRPWPIRDTPGLH